MPSIYQFSEVEMLAFFLVVLRISSFVVSWPVFGVPSVPATAKILFAFVLSLMVFPIIGWQKMPITADLMNSTEIVWLGLREITIGLIFGYLARLFFYSVNIAGDVTTALICDKMEGRFNEKILQTPEDDLPRNDDNL